jgi:hypothetical protein
MTILRPSNAAQIHSAVRIAAEEARLGLHERLSALLRRRKGGSKHVTHTRRSATWGTSTKLTYCRGGA